ncbi:MAG: secretin N-terminal domain-containing protein [Kiritimatiellales bacterium]
MRAKTTITIAALMLAAAVYAQEVPAIFSELKSTPSDPTRLEPVEPAPAVAAPPLAPVVMESVPAAPAVSAPAAVEPAPAVVDVTSVVTRPVNAPDSAVETIRIEPEPDSDATIKGGLISLSLKEVELSSVIRIFATLSDANIIVPELEDGAGATKVDVNLKDVEWKPALQSILETQGFELYEKNPGTSVYSVRKKPADAPASMNVKIFKMDYASVAGVSEMIKNMVPEPGKITVFTARNTIVVQSTPENLLEIDRMISAVDLPRQQVFIEAKFMELTDSASEKLGIDWSMLGGYGVAVKGINGSYNFADSKVDGISKGQNNYTDIAGRPYENIEELPDAPSASDYDGSLVNNIDYPARPGSAGADDSRTYGITPTTISQVTGVDQATVTRALGATLSASDFSLVLAALKEINGIKIVSNPKIIVANEETAQIYIGTKEPNIKQQTTQVQNADPITTYNLDPDTPYFEYGIKLNVTPSVNTSSNITVTIAPSLTRFVKDKTVGNAGTVNSFPVTTEKTIQTVFALESGQTAAIGGLTELESNDIDRKVPFLGNLPLIGRFFSYISKSKEQRETVIFVTVGLANPENINMETGLPQDSSLAMRQQAAMKNDRLIRAEKQKLLETQEAERSQEAIRKLRDAEQKRLQKKRGTAPDIAGM